jgi:hypothetical protein
MGHLIRGIIDGDGSIYWHSNGTTRCIRILGTSYLVAGTIVYLCSKLGITYHVPHQKPDSFLNFVDWSTESDVIKIAKFIYADTNNLTYIRRKHEVVKDMLC